MRLIRNTTPDGKCKYALVRLDKIRKSTDGNKVESQVCLERLEKLGFLEYAGKNDNEEAFVIKLKDAYAYKALLSYAHTASDCGDSELAMDVEELALRSRNHPKRKLPD